MNRLRAGVAAAALGLAVTAVAGCGSMSGSPSGSVSSTSGSRSPATDVQVITVSYAGGTITPPEGRVPVKVGQKVEIQVTSDVAEIVHNHYNNVEHDVAPGGTVVFDFTAVNPGIYEVELHRSNKLLLQLVVQ